MGKCESITFGLGDDRPDVAIGGFSMSVLGGRVAGLAAVVGIAALVSACAAPSPGAPDAAMNAMPTTLPGDLHSFTHAPAMQDLAGLKPNDILSLLGEPDLKRDEPPAELWQYRTADCVLNLFFYDNAGSYRLTHAEAWQRTLSAGSAPTQCNDENAPIKAHLITQSRL